MKKLLLTGGCGFVGRNIKPILDQRYDVTTCGLNRDNNVVVNLVTTEPTFPEKFDIILHACGKAHSIPKTEEDIQAFSDVNYQGTVNLCRALEKWGLPKSFIYLSSVAVYGLDQGDHIDESHPLQGTTPYAKSKIMAEKFLSDWCYNHNVFLTILRPSLIAGPNPPGNLGAMISGIKKRKYLCVARGEARKSLLMVQDIARLVTLAESKTGIYNVNDGLNPSFRELECIICSQLKMGIPLSIPYWFAKVMARLGDYFGDSFPINSARLNKMTCSLTFSCDKAQRELGWKPLSVRDYFKIL